jgi:hypothetical protein
VPHFSFTVLEVDGMTVAAIEILPGGRPFYALRDNGNLKRNYAHIRVGSTTDLASPDLIVGWVERDGNLRHRRLEAEKLEAEQTLRGRLTTAGGSKSQGIRRCKFEIHNEGIALFLPQRVTCEWHIDENAVFRWLSERHVRLLKPIAPYVDESKTITSAAVRPGTPSQWEVVYKQDELMAFLESSMRGRLQGVVPDNNVLRAFILDTAYCNVTVECENVGGTRELTLLAQFGWDPSRWAFPDPDTGSHAG